MRSQGSILAALPELKNVLKYDPGSGHFFWKQRSGHQPHRIHPGDIAGTRRPDGRVTIAYTFSDGSRELLRAHRLAWWFMTRKPIPDGYILDHINGVPSDNRWSNLRLVTPSQSNMNMPVRVDNKSGHRGIWWFDRVERWCAYINVGNRRIHLGLFKTMEAAVAARMAAEAKLYGKFNRRTSHG